MKASLDTNVIIHLYRAGQEKILFSCFADGIYIYEQIRRVELENHGQNILEKVDQDIQSGMLKIITDEELRENGVYSIFKGHVNDNLQLYSPQDRGEVLAISLAQTLGAYSLVTDDIKQGGPYMSLLQFTDNNIMPLTFSDVLLINYLLGDMEAKEAVESFDCINSASSLNWSFKSHLGRFIKRFFTDPYQESEKVWMQELCQKHQISAKVKMTKIKEKIIGSNTERIL